MATLTAPFAADRSDEPALIDERGTTTWRDLDERVNRLVNGLRAAGVSTGSTLAVVVGNRREWFEIAMACAHGGGRTCRSTGTGWPMSWPTCSRTPVSTPWWSRDATPTR